MTYYGNPPLVYTGDIFHEGWRSRGCPPRLVNWAIKNLPRGYAIPGNHDLPHHRYEDMGDSAYWTLVEAGILINLEPGGTTPIINADNQMTLISAFPYGVPIQPPRLEEVRHYTTSSKHIAVAHRYIYTKRQNPARSESEADEVFQTITRELSGYDAAVFGDNHHPFVADQGTCRVRNGGAFIPRRSDERDVKPSVGLLRPSGEWITANLTSPSKDQWDQTLDATAPAEVGALRQMGVDPDEFIGMVRELATTYTSLVDVINEFCRRNPVDKMNSDAQDRLIEWARKIGDRK